MSSAGTGVSEQGYISDSELYKPHKQHRSGSESDVSTASVNSTGWLMVSAFTLVLLCAITIPRVYETVTYVKSGGSESEQYRDWCVRARVYKVNCTNHINNIDQEASLVCLLLLSIVLDG